MKFFEINYICLCKRLKIPKFFSFSNSNANSNCYQIVTVTRRNPIHADMLT